MTRIGVLVAAFGGPRNLEEVEPFLVRLIGHKPPRPAIEGSKRKYEAIGGSSPLPGIVQEIVEALEAALAARGFDMPVRMGLRYSEPSLSDAVADLVAEDVSTILAVNLPSLESDYTTRSYREAITEAAVAYEGLDIIETAAYHAHAGLVAILADATAVALTDLSDSQRPLVMFTAHSLPIPEIRRDDTYVTQLRETVKAVADRAGLRAGMEVPWLLVYQSRGRRGSEWLEPDLSDAIRAAVGHGFDAVAVCPVGFITDHLETWYDLDIVARREAQDAGLAFARGKVPNTDSRLIDALVETVLSALPG